MSVILRKDEPASRRISVNVSPSQFARSDFVTDLLDALRENGVPFDLFEIEITESFAMLDSDAVDHALTQLREAGVRVAIDDFGTGFSNLSRLTRLPFDELKIDRSLIRDVCRSDRSQHILQAIISMAHGLGHQVVAEGVETMEQYALLQRLGCDEIQGFLFGRPMEAVVLERWQAGRHVNPVESLRLSVHEQYASRA